MFAYTFFKVSKKGTKMKVLYLKEKSTVTQFAIPLENRIPTMTGTGSQGHYRLSRHNSRRYNHPPSSPASFISHEMQMIIILTSKGSCNIK